MVRLLIVNSCRVLFWVVMLGGVGISLGRIRWLGVWAGMEVRLLGVYGVFCGGFSQREVVCCIKYFIVQVLRSSRILIGFLIRDWGVVVCTLGELMVNFGIFIKVGVFPFYFWVVPVIIGLSWRGGWIFCTFQKVIPLMVFRPIISYYTVLRDLCGLLRVMVAGWEGIKQVSIRGIFGYSSVGQSGWLLILCGRGDSGRIVWFSLIYRLVLISVFWGFLWFDPYNYVYKIKEFVRFRLLKVLNVVSIFSLVGLPPLLGFIPKLLVLRDIRIRLGIVSLILLWAVLARVWFYTSFLFLIIIERGGRLFTIFCLDLFCGVKDFLLIILFLRFNFVGGFVYFYI